jgi:hypothetical protein
MTPYVVLQRTEVGTWLEISRQTASSPERAVRGADPPEEGVYVAVPRRSWKPLTVKTEQKTTVTVTAA